MTIKAWWPWGSDDNKPSEYVFYAPSEEQVEGVLAAARALYFLGFEGNNAGRLNLDDFLEEVVVEEA